MARDKITNPQFIDRAAKAFRAYEDSRPLGEDGKPLPRAADAPKARLSDGPGLYLLLFADGGSHGWRFDYTLDGRRRTMSLGTYPDVGIAAARQAAADVREKVAAGIDPVAKRKEARAEKVALHAIKKAIANGDPLPGTFEAEAREYHRIKAPGWSTTYADKWIGRMELHVFPHLGGMRPDDIEPPTIMNLVLDRLIEAGKLEIAHTARQMIGQVYDWLVPRGRAKRNPANDLTKAVPPPRKRSMSAIIDATQVGVLMASIYVYSSELTRAALKLIAFTFQRPGNVRMMEWEEIDLERALWTIPAIKMKRRQHEKLYGAPHYVPLSRQAVEVLRAIKPLTGPTGYVFPSIMGKTRPMSDATMGKALMLLGWGREEMSAHGFRAMARTLIRQDLDIEADIIEAQLAHAKTEELGSTYDRAEFRDQRVAMMQRWADYLDQLRAKAVNGQETEREAA